MNVLYLSNLRDFWGGAERSLYEILKNIDKTKVTPFFATSQDGELAKAIKKLGIKTLSLRPFSIRRPAPILSITYALIRFIRENEIQIIHNNQCVDSQYSWIAAKITHTPIINHLRDSQYYRLDHFLINHVDWNICISNDLLHRFSTSRVTLIHNGIELDKYDVEMPYVADDHRRVEIGLIGRIVPQKGQESLIQAAKLVLQSNPEVHFRIYGDMNSVSERDYKQHLHSLVNEYQLENDVEFMGYAHDVVTALRQIDISVVPSSREPFGRVVIESMACQKPVIGSNIGGIPDIITDETGILVPPNDPAALADAILFLAKKPELRASMGRAGRIRIEEFFTTERTVLKIIDLYGNLLQIHE